MAVPTIVGYGAMVASAPGAVPNTHASTLTGDLVLVFMYTANQAFPVFPQTGGTMTAYAAPNQPTGFGTAGAAGGVRGYIAYGQAPSDGAFVPFNTGDSGSVNIARCLTIRGADMSDVAGGSPFDLAATSNQTTANTSVSWDALTTTGADRLILNALFMDRDASSTAEVSSYANSNLTSVAEQFDGTVTTGAGGGLFCGKGEKASAGSTGSSTATIVSQVYSKWTAAIKPAGAATQNLTQSARFNNAQTFYTHTLTPGAVSLTQSARFDNAQTFYAHTISQAINLTQSARFDNAQAFYTHSLTLNLAQGARFDNAQAFYTHSLTLNLTQGARFDNAQTFYAHTVEQGQTLTQSTRFDNAQTFYAHILTPGAVTLTQSARFDNAQAFYAHSLTLNLTQDARFDNAQTFYAHSLTLNLVQGTRFDNAQTFYTHTLTTGPVTLTQGARFDNAQTFYAHTLAQTTNLSQSARFDNAQTFYAHTLSLNLTQGARFDNAQAFYTHALSLNLIQGARFDNAQTFYTHTLTTGPMTLTQGARFDNAQAFQTHSLYNQYPDPSEVLLGVDYGEPGLMFTGTLTGGYDGSLKIDVATGRMVKLVSNKVALSF